MSDRVTALFTVPVDYALPVDVQGVFMRRQAIEAMSEVAEIDESTVRYTGASDSASVQFDDRVVSVWQHSLLAVMFRADGKALSGVCGSVEHYNAETKTNYRVEVVRDL